MKHIFFLLLPFCLLLGGCKSNPKAVTYYETNPQYTWGYVLFYGNYYNNVGIENNVLSMSLFTENMEVENGNLTGTGQYLNIEELCIAPADTMMPIGTYTISNTREPMTALAGEVPEEYPYTIIGANILYVEDGSSTYMLIESGTFTIHSAEEDEYHISFDFVATDLAKSETRELRGEFKGQLPHYDARQKQPENTEMQKVLAKDLLQKTKRTRPLL